MIVAECQRAELGATSRGKLNVSHAIKRYVYNFGLLSLAYACTAGTALAQETAEDANSAENAGREHSS